MRIFAAIMTQEEKTQIEERIVDVLKTVYDRDSRQHLRPGNDLQD